MHKENNLIKVILLGDLVGLIFIVAGFNQQKIYESEVHYVEPYDITAFTPIFLDLNKRRNSLIVRIHFIVGLLILMAANGIFWYKLLSTKIFK